MVGRKVKILGYGQVGTVIRWTPLSEASSDILLRLENGVEHYANSEDAVPLDDLGPLPSRKEAQEKARLEALEHLEGIRARHVNDFGRSWPGAEFGKAIVGKALMGALESLNPTNDVGNP